MSDEGKQLRLLGQAIRAARKERNLTVPDLAASVGVSLARLHAVEEGRVDPDFELLLRIAESMNVRPSTFIIRAEELGSTGD